MHQWTSVSRCLSGVALTLGLGCANSELSEHVSGADTMMPVTWDIPAMPYHPERVILTGSLKQAVGPFTQQSRDRALGPAGPGTRWAGTIGMTIEKHANGSYTVRDDGGIRSLYDGAGNPIAGIRKGNRLPTSPDLQIAGTVAYNFTMGTSLESYVRLMAQHVGSSYTQLADQEPGFGFISNDPAAPAGSAALINLGNVDGDPALAGIQPTTITFDPRLEKYDLVNLRWGISTDKWEGGLYVNNLFDEIAHLSIDRERGRRARVGYLTNVPRTYGVNFRFNF